MCVQPRSRWTRRISACQNKLPTSVICITTDTNDSPSEEVEADLPAAEADVPGEPSESRDPAREMFYGKGLLLVQRALRKDPCRHVWRGSSVSGCSAFRSVRITLGFGVRSVSVRRWSLDRMCEATVCSSVLTRQGKLQR